MSRSASRRADPRLFAMAAIAAGCADHQLVHVSDRVDTDAAGPRAAAARCVWLAGPGERRPSGVRPDATIASLDELPAALATLDAEGGDEPAAVGVGPHPGPWPDDPRLDPELLTERRSSQRRRPVPLLAHRGRRGRPRPPIVTRSTSPSRTGSHDLNIGTVVRNANAFLGGHRADRRTTTMEPAGRHGHRSLPAHRAPIARSMS